MGFQPTIPRRQTRMNPEMNTILPPKHTEFFHRKPENFLFIENREDGVIIRAAHDNFSEERKFKFIRELAAEGFIPDHFQWFADRSTDGMPRVKWLIDDSWIKSRQPLEHNTDRFVLRLFLTASVLWLVLIGKLVIFAGVSARF